jgi:hypothetical protein
VGKRRIPVEYHGIDASPALIDLEGDGVALTGEEARRIQCTAVAVLVVRQACASSLG